MPNSTSVSFHCFAGSCCSILNKMKGEAISSSRGLRELSAANQRRTGGVSEQDSIPELFLAANAPASPHPQNKPGLIKIEQSRGANSFKLWYSGSVWLPGVTGMGASVFFGLQLGDRADWGQLHSQFPGRTFC
jgi:hypothetical protein